MMTGIGIARHRLLEQDIIAIRNQSRIGTLRYQHQHQHGQQPGEHRQQQQ